MTPYSVRTLSRVAEACLAHVETDGIIIASGVLDDVAAAAVAIAAARLVQGKAY
jgi:hypothetical protein